jgi:hypothetical protein
MPLLVPFHRLGRFEGRPEEAQMVAVPVVLSLTVLARRRF